MTAARSADLLRASPLFAGLPPREVDALAAVARQSRSNSASAHSPALPA